VAEIRTLVRIYEALRKSQRLIGVQQAFGGLQKLGETASPRIVWVPLEDRADGAPRVAALNTTIEGKPVQVRTIGTVARSCELTVEVAATGDTTCYDELEALLNRLYLALHDEMQSTANYSLGICEWVDRDEISEGFIGCVVIFEPKIPIYDLLNTAQLQSAVPTVKAE